MHSSSSGGGSGHWGGSGGNWNGQSWHGNWGSHYRYYGYRNRYYGYYGYRYPWYAWGYYPYLYSYGGWGYPSNFWYDTGYSNDYGAYTAPAYPAYDYAGQQAEQIQQQEIERLNNEVERLRDQEDGQRYAQQPPPAPASNPTIHAETVLVFRDKHVEQVENYAVVGQVIWIFNEQRARKVPISQIDVPATTKANEDRGIDFRLPRQ